jgi:periplasmic divalent cation tolerance protein
MRLVLCNCPPHEAEGLASRVIDAGLAACVNWIPAVRSMYMWEGERQIEEETTLLCKVSEEHVAALVTALQEWHPYDVPEVLVLPVDMEHSSQAYVSWVRGVAPKAAG